MTTTATPTITPNELRTHAKADELHVLLADDRLAPEGFRRMVRREEWRSDLRADLDRRLTGFTRDHVAALEGAVGAPAGFVRGVLVGRLAREARIPSPQQKGARRKAESEARRYEAEVGGVHLGASAFERLLEEKYPAGCPGCGGSIAGMWVRSGQWNWACTRFGCRGRKPESMEPFYAAKMKEACN